MRKENVFLLFSIIVILAGGLFFFKEGKIYIEKKRKQEIEKIAECLLEKKIKLYVVSDCQECEEQKEVFGDRVGALQIIDCGNQKNWKDDCKSKKINSFPVWVTDFKVNSIKSCSECRKKNTDMKCNNFCYTQTEGEKFYKIVGFMNLSQIKEIFSCQK